MKTTLLAAVVAAVLGLTSAARASIIPTLESITASGSDYKWNYQGTLAGDQGVSASNGSRLVIFDFAGYVPGSIYAPSPDITASVEAVSTGLVTAPGFVDNPSLVNLVFTWNGPDFQTSGGPYADVNFNGIGAESIYNLIKTGVYAAKTVKNNGPLVGSDSYNTGFDAVPTAVPEPAAWAMLLIGLGGVGVAMRSRRRFGAAMA